MTKTNMIKSADVSQGKKPLIDYKYAFPPLTPIFPIFPLSLNSDTEINISHPLSYYIKIYLKYSGIKFFPNSSDEFFSEIPTELDICSTFHISGGSICYPDSGTYVEAPRMINPFCTAIVDYIGEQYDVAQS